MTVISMNMGLISDIFKGIGGSGNTAQGIFRDLVQ